MNRFRGRVDIIEAINRCDWQKVKDAVIPGKANVRDPQYDATLLHWAVNEGHVPTVEHLLACGADVRLKDGKHAATPLHWAAAKGHVFVVRLLMMRESDVNSRDASDRTPLHWAAGNGQLGVIRELFFWGARVECTDAWRKVPLHWAAFRGHVTSVEELVGRGSPVDQVDQDDNVPGSTFHPSVPEEARESIRAAMKRGPASGDSVVRAATVSSELLLETLHACRSWGELFENRHFDELSKECQDHRTRLRGVIQGLAEQGTAELLEPCLKAMDLLNSALGLHEDMRSGTKPVPLKASDRVPGVGRSGTKSGSGSGGGGSGAGRTDDADAGPPRAGGEGRASTDLNDFLAPRDRQSSTASDDGTPGSSSAASLRLYQLPAVREACGGFDQKRCIGEGGFGKVYRGSMMGLPVAVKKLDETGLQGREQFFREVEVLSTCRHENIVPLLGVCMEPACLVYRLMPNNSLRHHLDDPGLKAKLGWRLRVRTTLHTCRGLEYLHKDSKNKPKVVHGDIKPENILLDEYLKARLSDFGISRVGETDVRSQPPSRATAARGRPSAEADLQGTFGYMDPVYQSTGRLDERSDVYSLGVVMLELLTGDPVHSPKKSPPGLVDRIRKALEDRALKSVVDRSAGWSKAAAKAYARLACRCCAENPTSRPSLREVEEKIAGILETGRRHDEAAGTRTASTMGTESADIGDLLELSAPNTTSSNERNGGSNRHSYSRRSSEDHAPKKYQHQQQQNHPLPPPPPPPYDSTAEETFATSQPPPYHVAAASSGIAVAERRPSPRRERHHDSRETEQLVDLSVESDSGSTSAQHRGHPPPTEKGAAWWGETSVDADHVKKVDSGVAISSESTGTDRWSPPLMTGAGREAGRGGRVRASRNFPTGILGDSSNGSITRTRSNALSEYGVDLLGVLQAAMTGGVLSSNPRLLCVSCDASDTDDGASVPLPPVADIDGEQSERGYVSVLDLWHRGRTVKYPVAAARAAMSPNQSESVIAVHDGGRLQVLSIPRNCRLQEQALGTHLCMWRWLSPWCLALVTANAVYYWSVSDVPSSGGSLGGDEERADKLDRDIAARFRTPRRAFDRHCTRAEPDALHRVYDYQASADGQWGMLCCAVVDFEGDYSGGGNENGYGSASSSVGGGGGPVKVDLYSFERSTTFEFEVLGAALMIMPGSSPPLNILGLIVRGDGGAAELRVLDLDRSLTQAVGQEALARLAMHGEGWLIATTHVIAEEDLRGSAGCRVVDADIGSGQAALVSPPVFLRQWTENTNVLFLVGCHGLLLLLDVVTGAELARAEACTAPIVEAEVDADLGDLVVISAAGTGGIYGLTVRSAALRESVEYDHKDPEMATRVSALTGYTGSRSLPQPTREDDR